MSRHVGKVIGHSCSAPVIAIGRLKIFSPDCKKLIERQKLFLSSSSRQTCCVAFCNINSPFILFDQRIVPNCREKKQAVIEKKTALRALSFGLVIDATTRTLMSLLSAAAIVNR